MYLLYLGSASFDFIIPILAAAAKSLQSCPTLCNPIDSSPPGSPSQSLAYCKEWWQLSGIVLPGLRNSHMGGLESLMAVISMFIYMTGNTPFYSAMAILIILIFPCMQDIFPFVYGFSNFFQ